MTSLDLVQFDGGAFVGEALLHVDPLVEQLEDDGQFADLAERGGVQAQIIVVVVAQIAHYAQRVRLRIRFLPLVLVLHLVCEHVWVPLVKRFNHVFALLLLLLRSQVFFARVGTRVTLVEFFAKKLCICSFQRHLDLFIRIIFRSV